ncbi:MAG: PASTA domain-containing protein, partial [Candidatus Hydrothermae bacterium]|nr:PASTA domain-containing protein [Candidatus Hydrothermae bacterium]
EKPSEFPKGAVAEQDPEPGMVVKKGFRIALILSSGPPEEDSSSQYFQP